MKIKLKLNTELKGLKEGTVLDLEVDTNKTILDKYWRRRFEDAKIDGCVEIVKKEKINKGDD